jgi:hypothetical protein
MLTREAILEIDDIETEAVSVPEWGGHVTVGTMSAGARDQWEATRYFAIKDGDPGKDIRATLVALSCVDPEFTLKDVEALSKKSAAALDRIYAVSLRLSKIGADDVEALEKN